MGVSCSSSCVCLAERIGTAALVDCRPAHAGVQIAGRERGGRDASEPGPEVLRVHEGKTPAHILRREPSRKVQRGARDVGVDIHAAGEHNQAGRVDGAPAAVRRFEVRQDAAIGDTDVLDDTVDPVRRVVNPSAGYPQHDDEASQRL